MMSITKAKKHIENSTMILHDATKVREGNAEIIDVEEAKKAIDIFDIDYCEAIDRCDLLEKYVEELANIIKRCKITNNKPTIKDYQLAKDYFLQLNRTGTSF